MPSYAAFDLGASNGRCILGRFDGQRLSLEMMHWFENGPVELNGRLFWDILGIYNQVRHSLVKLGEACPQDLASIGVDTWGCDFALLDRQGKLAGNPYSYRDVHTAGMIPRLFERMPRERIFEITGLQFIEPNSLVQLHAMQLRADPILQGAATFLHIGDLLHHWLTGVRACEVTNASTSQLMDARSRSWSLEIIRAFELDPDLFPTIIPAGTALGRLRPLLQTDTGLQATQVVATATHDTAAAVAAAPISQRPSAYISSGTWAILGKEIPEPLLTPTCLAGNIANEGGAAGNITLLKNIVSMWLVQECRRLWALHGEKYSWEELTGLAAGAQPFLAFIDPDEPIFLRPGDIPIRVQQYCRDTGQAVPQDNGQVLRVIFESLAFKYRFVLEQIDRLTGEKSAILHIIGGGSRNLLLNQYTADATNCPVQAGPAEATAAGNILVQMVALGELSDYYEARELVARSFPAQNYAPQLNHRWDEHYPRFLEVTSLLTNVIDK